MRDRYLRQLKLVHDDLLRMGSRVEHALVDAMQALASWDTSLARRVIAGDQEIDEARTSIEPTFRMSNAVAALTPRSCMTCSTTVPAPCMN